MSEEAGSGGEDAATCEMGKTKSLPATWGSLAPLSSEMVVMSLHMAELDQLCHLEGDLGGNTQGK